VLAHDQTIRKGQPFRYSEFCEHAVMGVPSECSSFRTKEAPRNKCGPALQCGRGV